MKSIKVLILLSFIMLLSIDAFSVEKSITKDDIISSFEPTIAKEYDNSFSIRSFDVNESGDVIISVREKDNNFFEATYGYGNYALYIYDSKMTLKYGIKIKSTESSVGAIWKNGYPTAVIGYNDALLISFDESGDVIFFEEIERKQNSAFEKEKTINGKTYLLTNSKNAAVPVFVSPSGEYKYLFMKDSDDITVLYENKTNQRSFDQHIPIIAIMGLILIIFIVGAGCIVWFVLIRKLKKGPKDNDVNSVLHTTTSKIH